MDLSNVPSWFVALVDLAVCMVGVAIGFVARGKVDDHEPEQPQPKFCRLHLPSELVLGDVQKARGCIRVWNGCASGLCEAHCVESDCCCNSVPSHVDSPVAH